MGGVDSFISITPSSSKSQVRARRRAARKRHRRCGAPRPQTWGRRAVRGQARGLPRQPCGGSRPLRMERGRDVRHPKEDE